MAIPSRQIGWGTEENLLWQISKQLEYLTGVTYKSLSELAPTYKVYTALLTQSGGDNQILLSDSDLTIGVTYFIDNNAGGTVDFTNVGAPNNNVGTYFVATGTTPNSWGTPSAGEIFYNTGAPVVTVLENTIGDIWFTYQSYNFQDGIYNILSNNLFIENKTALFIGTPNDNASPPGVFDFYRNFDNQIQLLSFDMSSTLVNGQLYNTPIEIRVYN
jgi:hypothetical protein